MRRRGIPAPWSRAWWTLWRQPAVILAVAAAAFLVALPAASASLFLSSASNATLQQQVNSACKWLVGAQWNMSLPFVTPSYLPPGDPAGQELLDQRVHAVESAAAGVPRLSAPVVTLIGSAKITPAQPDQARVTLLSRDGFADNVEVLSGGGGPGVWLPDAYAAAQHFKVGDRISVAMGDARFALPVAAVYRDLRASEDQQFWCSLRDVYRGKPLGEAPVLPLALISRGDFVKLASAAHVENAGNYIELSVDSAGLTTTSVTPVVDGLERMRQRVPIENAGVTSNLAGMVERARLVGSALIGTVVPLAAVGALAGLVIAAAAGAFWVDRRRGELTVLSARGVGPFALMGKAVLEVLGAVVLGTAAGWIVARWLIGAVGPSPLVTPGSVAASAGGAAAALLLTLGAIAVTSGRRTAILFDRRPQRTRNLPWEVLPLLAALLTWFLLADPVDVGTGTSGTVARIPPRLVVVPILLIVGLAMLTGRLVRRGLSRAPSLLCRLGPSPRPQPGGKPPWTPQLRLMSHASVFLAWRRVIAAPVAAAILVGATAVPVALSVYATTVTGSVDRTLHAEAQLIVGSDVVLGLAGPVTIPPELAGQATVVERFDSARIGDTTVNVLGVDPATFARAAFWDPGLPGVSLDAAMANLSDPGRPAGVLSGLSTSDTATVTIQGTVRQLAITTADQLPGKTSGYPLLLVRRDLVDSLAGGAQHPQLWVRGDPDRIFAALGRAGIQGKTVSQAREVTAKGVYTPITYTFAFLAAVSLLAGAIIAVGLLLHLSARARARRSAYVLLRRMGIGAFAHWRALAFEVGGMLLAGFAAGLGLAGVVVALTRNGYDLNPTTPPGTVLDWPWSLAAELAVAALAATVLATAIAQRTVSAARPAEVLRDTR